jgi:hypothetical protein
MWKCSALRIFSALFLMRGFLETGVFFIGELSGLTKPRAGLEKKRCASIYRRIGWMPDAAHPPQRLRAVTLLIRSLGV